MKRCAGGPGLIFLSVIRLRRWHVTSTPSLHTMPQNGEQNTADEIGRLRESCADLKKQLLTRTARAHRGPRAADRDC